MLTRDVDRRETLKWLDHALRRSRPQNLDLARDCVHQLAHTESLKAGLVSVWWGWNVSDSRWRTREVRHAGSTAD